MKYIAKVPKRLWKLDSSQLVPGDVLLERGRGLLGAAIRVVDFGGYAHALIWCGPTDFFEAVGNGTRAISFARFFIEKPRGWMLMRLVGNPTAAAEAAFQARNLAHVPYSAAGAVKTKLPFFSPTDSGQFCSQLVALCYQRAGIELVDGAEPHKVSPAKLEKKSRLTPVALPLVEVTDPDERKWAAQFLDRDASYQRSGPARGMRVSQAVMADLADRLSLLRTPETSEKTHPPRNIVEVLTMLQIVPVSIASGVADAMLAAMRKHGYLSMLDDALPEVSSHIGYRHVRLGNPALPADERLAIETEFKVLVGGWLASRDRHWLNFEIFDQTNVVRPHALWRELAAMHRRYADIFNDLIEQARSDPLAKL